MTCISSLTLFHAATRKRFARIQGFTLIELVVVMALIGIVMFFAVPNFQHLLADDMRKTSQWLLLQVPQHRARAVSESKTYLLHADMDENRLWFSNDGMSDEELLQARNLGLVLADSIFIQDIVYANGDSVDSGEALIGFYPKGYSDKVILHLREANGDRRSFFFEPFLNQVELKEGYIDFEG